MASIFEQFKVFSQSQNWSSQSQFVKTHETQSQIRQQIKDVHDAFKNLIQEFNAEPSYKPVFQELIDLLIKCPAFNCETHFEALLYLEPLIQDQVAFKEAIYDLIFPYHDLSEHLKKEALGICIYFGETPWVMHAIAEGANIHTPLYGTITPIIQACYKGDENIAWLLLENGADVQCIGGDTTPLAEARMQRHFSQELIEEIRKRDAGFTPEFFARKIFFHLFSEISLSGKSKIGNKEFILEGFSIPNILQIYLNRAKPFYQSTSWFEKLFEKIAPTIGIEAQDQMFSISSLILESFEHAFTWEQRKKEILPLQKRKEEFVREALERLDHGLPVICFGGTYINAANFGHACHAWGMTALKLNDHEYLVQLCNRGGGTNCPGVIPRKITREEFLKLWGDFEEASDLARDFKGSKGKYVYDSTSKAFYPYREDRIVEKEQAIGNCCDITLQSIELSLWVALLMRYFPFLQKEETVSIGKIARGLRKGFARDMEISEYVARHFSSASEPNSPLYDTELLSSIYLRSIENPKFINIYSQLISKADFFDQILKDNALVAAWPKIRRSLAPQKVRPLPNRNAEVHEIREFINSEAGQNAMQQIQTLDLSKCQLRVFPEELFCMTQLKELNLRSCDLRKIPQLSFPNLTVLDLSLNFLQIIPPLSLPKLEMLFLQENRLQTLPDLTQVPQLKTLDASKNQISDLTGPLPIGLLNLSLVKNRFQNIHFSPLPSLTTLSLSKNPLGKIPALPTPGLSSLYLEEIGLSSINEEDKCQIESLSQLKWLNMSGNRLTAIPQFANVGLEITPNNTIEE